jgi:Fe-S oxidoreductase
MLTTAKWLLRQILETLEPQIIEGVPIVGLEPSCVAVFRDELLNFFPNDENARRLSKQTYLLSEFLATKVPDFHPPELRRKALVHGHCHQKAIMRIGADEVVLKKLGLDFEILDSGCCGMAGAFGFEKEHYDVSIKCGERVLLPAVRSAASDTLIIANGFSCQEQIAQTTERRALHLAQVIQMAMREGDTETAGAFPETSYVTQAAHRSLSRTPIAVGASAVLLIGAAVMWMLRKRKPR